VRGNGVLVGELTRGGAPTVTFVVEQIESLDGLQRAIHGDAAVDAPQLGLTRNAGKAGFSRRCHFNRYSAYLMLRVTAAHSFRESRDPCLTPRATELLADREWFRNEFGDAYVRGIVAGGELYGLIEFGTGTDEEQQAIAGIPGHRVRHLRRRSRPRGGVGEVVGAAGGPHPGDGLPAGRRAPADARPRQS
jgi:hypothetical protein